MQTSRLNVIKAFLNSILNLKMLTLLGIFIFSISALAMNGRTTYQAKIIKPDGYPLEASSVNFRFTVLDTVGSCVLYVEEYTAVNMSQSGGLISFALGNGARSFPASGTSQTFQNTFDNSVTSFSCQTPGIYNPGPNDTRKIVMQFHDGNGWQTLPAMTINTVPYAMYASKSNDSKTLNGKADTAFVENSTLAALNCNPATHAITFNGVSFSCISVGGGGGGITSVATSGTVLSTGGTASAPVISIQAATMSQDGYLTSLDYTEFKAKLSASSTQIVNTLGYAPVSGAAVATQINNSNLSGDVSGTISSNSVVSVAGKTASQISTSVDDTLAATSSATADTIVKRNSSGNATFNDVYANAAKINYVDIYKPSTSFNIRLQAPTSLSTNYVLNLPTTSGTTGQVLSTDGAGNLSWINSSTGSVVSVSATAPLASTGGSNPTISIAQATSSTDGYLSSTDWNTFNNKQAATSAAIIATLGYTPATSTTLAASFVQKTGDTMTGILILKAGTTTNAPLKFTSGTLLSSAQSGTIEYDGSQLYFTDGANTRRAIATNSTPGSFDNTSSISNTSGNITLSPNSITGSVIVNSSQASISSGTGALVVNGGVGIAGSINGGGNLNLTGSATIGQSLQLSSMTSGSLLFVGASGLVSEDNSRLFWDGANKRLGLGTNSPVQTLSVSGASYFSGNVGIGTSSPASALDVSGFVTLSNLPTGPSGIHKSIDTGYIEMIGANASNLGAGIYLSGNNFSGVPTLAAGDAAISIASAASKIRFQVLGNDLMSITGQGNVGVGTSAPGARLEVSRNASASTAFDEVLRITQVNGTNGGAGPGLFFYGGTNNQAFGAIGGWNVSDGVGAQSAKLRFQTANAGTLVDRMVIDESGNVGVGTTTPTAKLQLAAGTSSTASFKLASGTLLTSPQSGTMEYDGAQFYLTDGTNTRRTIATGSSVGTIDNASTINSTGNITMVPVGSVVVSATTASTNSQTGSLVVKGGLGITGNLYSSGTIVTSSNIQGTSITATSGVSTTVIQGVPYLALNPNGGNVGIGTTSPDKTLVVNSTSTTNFAAEIYNSSSAAASNGLYVHSASTNPATMVAAIGSLSVMGDGNVGIGTTAPQAKLDVMGNIATNSGVFYNSTAGNSALAVLSGDTTAGTATANIAVWGASHTTYPGDVHITNRGSGATKFYNYTGSTWTQLAHITSGGSLGIGTASPSGILHLSSNATTGSQLIIQNTDTGGATVGIISTGSTNAGGAGLMRFDNPMGTDRMVINGSGNVGIGTTNPSQKLSFGSEYDQIKWPTALGVAGGIVGDDGNYKALTLFHGDSVRFETGANTPGIANERMRITSTGNVGIGTATPGHALHVTTSSADPMRVHMLGDTYGGGAGGIIISSDGASSNSYNFLKGIADYNGTPSTQFMIDSTGGAYFAGNVGVGTTTPSSYQHGGANKVAEIYNSGTALNSQSHFILSSGNTNNADSSIGTITFAQPNMSDANKGLALIAGRTDTDYTQANPSSLLAFWTRGASETNWSQKMIIKGNGNVGIGTTSPSEKLYVNGPIATANSSIGYDSSANNDGRSGIVFGANHATGNSMFWITPDATTGNKLHISNGNGFSDSSSNGITLTNAGYFGIGTTSPQRKFHVSGGGIQMSNGTVGDGLNDGFLIDYSSNDVIFSNRRTGGKLRFGTNGFSDKFVITDAGYVGIGTTSPSYKLDVSGTIRGYGITDSSDIRLKKDIQPLGFSLEKLLQVNGVTYYWKNPDMPKKQIGFIAQQLEKIYPELVETDQDGFKSVNYSHLIAPVIESIKTLYHRTVNTERRVASLEKINNDKEKQIQAMQKALCEMGRQEFCNDK